MSLLRTLKNIRILGLREYAHQMMNIGDAKVGKMVGKDQFGNKYYEQLDWQLEVPGRHRWIDYAQSEYNASQVPPEWHAWLEHIRLKPPQEDEVVKAVTPPWLGEYRENLTGTRGAFKTYNTTAPKIRAWEPTVKSRSSSSA